MEKIYDKRHSVQGPVNQRIGITADDPRNIAQTLLLFHDQQLPKSWRVINPDLSNFPLITFQWHIYGVH